MKINLSDVQALELDVSKLAADYIEQNRVGGTIAEPLVHILALDILKFGYERLNAAILAANAKP